MLDGVIGCGSRTVVYRGTLESYDARRPVAVKVFDGIAPADRAAFVRRFDVAATRAACVVNARVVATYDHRVGDGAPFVVTERVDGTSLDRILAGRSGALDIDHAVLIALRAAEALDAAWSGDHPDGGKLHLAHGALCARDVFINARGVVAVADFGLSDPYEASRAKTVDPSSPRLAATAPEIAAGASPSARADVFALGVLLHELVAAPRFAWCSSPADALRGVRAGIVRENPFAMASLPTSLRDVIRCATEGDPMQRFADAGALAASLRRIARPLGVRDSARLPVSRPRPFDAAIGS